MTRNANKENRYENLTAWCAHYHKESGLKVHPSSVPTDLVLEDILGYVAILMRSHKDLASDHDYLATRVTELEEALSAANTELTSLKENKKVKK